MREMERDGEEKAIKGERERPRAVVPGVPVSSDAEWQVTQV